MIEIGRHRLLTPTVLAPMAGVTDRPFRQLCRHFGAALTPSEMITSNIKLWDSEKNRLRRCHDSEDSPRVVQIAGSDPRMMAWAARMNVLEGAEIIDINMGCPAKKVLKKDAGSALLKNETLVREILESVVEAVDVPVTLKIRTGWDTAHRNGVRIARIAEDSGIKALAVHGRTRECRFSGAVEYDTIAAIKAAITLPVFANGDIDSPEQAEKVLAQTGADAVMIGRGAQGRPWIFREINARLEGKDFTITAAERIRTILQHVQSLHDFYGSFKGVLFARKHVKWYCQYPPDSGDFYRHFNALQSPQEQLTAIRVHFAAPIQAMNDHTPKVVAA